MARHGATHHFVSTVDDVAWITVLRGADVDYNPVFLAHLLIDARPGGRASLFIAPGKVPAELAAQARGAKPLARLVGYAHTGLDPKIMGVGPIHASRKALTKAGWKVGDLDLVEANEAFAAQA